MKKLIYALTTLVALGASSCKEDEINYSPSDLPRLPRTMFRSENSTNQKPEADEYASKLVPGKDNVVQLYWYGVEGAAGYEIRYAQNLNTGVYEDWCDTLPINGLEPKVKTFVVGPHVLNAQIQHLEYGSDYRFIIRVLSPQGESHHSEWYGLGGGREWEDYLGITTNDVTKPTPCQIEEKGFTDAVISFDLTFNPKEFSANDVKEINDDGTPNENCIQNRYEIKDGKFVATTVVCRPAPYNVTASMPEGFTNGTRAITQEELASGKIKVTGLDMNSGYYFYLRNDNKLLTYTDNGGKQQTTDIYALYGPMFIRTLGVVGEPQIIEPIVDPNDTIPGAVEYNATRIDTIINNFVNSNQIAEGQVYYLRGGHNYYTEGNPLVQKGFTLATHPDDLAQGKRATVFLGGIGLNGETPRTGNWVLGKNKEAGDVDAPIEISDVIFEGIDFKCPLARNFGMGQVTGNYFVNMYSGGLAVTFESFQLKNCTFQGFVRGFIRVQGPRYKVFKKFLVEDCLFYNQGYYDNNGRGYTWFAGDGGHVKTNLWNEFILRRCTFYDSPRHALISDNNKSLAWGDGVKFNITVENCTFVNFSTRSKSRMLLDLRYLPNDSKITFKNNLIVLAKDPADKRDLNQAGSDIREVSGAGWITFDVKDNYSLGCTDDHMKDDGIFNAAAFSASKNSMGAMWDWYPGLVSGDKEDLKVKVGATPLRADEFFNNPNPPYKSFDKANPNVNDHAAPADIFNALKVKTDTRVQSHEIYQKRIGDPRWYN